MASLFMQHIVSITILLFLLITFLQSGIDKISDWKRNISWLKEHFSSTFIAPFVPLSLLIILIAEIVSSILAIIGLIYLLKDGHTIYAIWAMFASSITLLILLLGQRIAKDYQGALTITCYFMVAVFGLYVITQA